MYGAVMLNKRVDLQINRLDCVEGIVVKFNRTDGRVVVENEQGIQYEGHQNRCEIVEENEELSTPNLKGKNA